MSIRKEENLTNALAVDLSPIQGTGESTANLMVPALQNMLYVCALHFPFVYPYWLPSFFIFTRFQCFPQKPEGRYQLKIPVMWEGGSRPEW